MGLAIDAVNSNEPAPQESPNRVRVQTCRHGLMCYFPHDIYIGRALDRYGEYSEGEVELFQKLLKPGHVVIEVGANIGALTVPLSRMVQDNGRVFCFEPQRIMFQQLNANVAMNGCFNVWTYQQAVGNKTGEIGVPLIDYKQSGNFGGVELVDDSPEMVPLIRLDDRPYNQIFPHFIKLDCEGMEQAVIEGADDMIQRARPAMYIENDRDTKSSALIQALHDRQYDLYWHVVLLYNPNNWRGDSNDDVYRNGDNVLASANMICLPRELKIDVKGLRKVEKDHHPFIDGIAAPTETLQ